MLLKRIFVVLSIFLLASISQAQTTAIPDEDFEQKLINLGYDDVLDGTVLTANIENIVSINLMGNSFRIADLTGIQDFQALEILNIQANELTTLDLSTNLNLVEVYADNNYDLASVDISNLSNLEVFRSRGANITSIDLSDNIAMRDYRCFDCQLSTIDVTSNPNLVILSVDDNSLTDIQFLNNNALEILQVVGNNLTTIDLEEIPNLVTLLAQENSLHDLNFSLVPNLEWIQVHFNDFTTLDFSGNSSLRHINAYGNFLLNFNVKNGNNQNLESLSTIENPGLLCIQVDDEIAANNGEVPYEYWNLDPQTGFSEQCSLLEMTDVEKAPIKVYPNPVNNELHLNYNDSLEIKDFQLFDVSGRAQSVHLNSLHNAVQMDHLSNGIYLYKITTVNGSTFVGKIVKE